MKNEQRERHFVLPPSTWPKYRKHPDNVQMLTHEEHVWAHELFNEAVGARVYPIEECSTEGTA